MPVESNNFVPILILEAVLIRTRLDLVSAEEIGVYRELLNEAQVKLFTTLGVQLCSWSRKGNY